MNVLITGGAGYIGSFMVKRLLEGNNAVTVLDSLERGNEKAIDGNANFVQENILDQGFLERIFSDNKFDVIIHFAGYISVSESVKNPYLYFQNNTYGSLNLINAAMKKNVSNIIFSSTAGVYGKPIKTPIPEDHPRKPENPYGESKLLVEQILNWYAKTKGLNFIALRYFNVAGAALDSSLGKWSKSADHIIANLMKSALTKHSFELFGDDYKTNDGSCIRDYIHVLDLIEAHILAIKKLNEQPGSYVYNVGTGKGYSNKEVIEMVKKITGENFKVKITNRRPGDVETVIADPAKIKRELGFKPKYSDLKTIIETEWAWYKQRHKATKEVESNA
jgi:UDP-glucose 4-epimerase